MADPHYNVFEDPDGAEWPGWCFTTPEGLQVTVTAVREGAEEEAHTLARMMADFYRPRPHEG